MTSIEMLATKIADLERENSLLRGSVHRLDDIVTKLDSKLETHIADYSQRVFATLEISQSDALYQRLAEKDQFVELEE